MLLLSFERKRKKEKSKKGTDRETDRQTNKQKRKKGKPYFNHCFINFFSDHYV